MLIPGVLFITCSAAFKRCVLLDMFQGPHALACSAQVSEQPRSLLLSAPKQAKWLKVGCCVLGCARLGGSATGLCLVVEVLHNYEVECRVVHASLGLPSCFELKDATSSALARGTSGLGAAGADEHSRLHLALLTGLGTGLQQKRPTLQSRALSLCAACKQHSHVWWWPYC